jgi:hypothetical protein
MLAALAGVLHSLLLNTAARDPGHMATLRVGRIAL